MSAKGHSSYVVYRRWPGTKGAPTRRSLGSTKHVVLAEARSRARDWLTQAANGHDPLAAVRAAHRRHLQQADEQFQALGNLHARELAMANSKMAMLERQVDGLITTLNSNLKDAALRNDLSDGLSQLQHDLAQLKLKRYDA